jgi:hypothetical protein
MNHYGEANKGELNTPSLYKEGVRFDLDMKTF